MFRKLVSSLPFSPALVGQLGFYTRRLSREQATRRLGLIFTMLALIIQAFALFSPPEQTLAASPSTQCAYNSALAKSDTDCKPCPYNTLTWLKDSSCNHSLSLSIDAIDLSQNGKRISSVTAQPGDRLQYTLRTVNTNPIATTTNIEVHIADLLEYATVIDSGGGTINTTAKTVNWGVVLLKAKQTDARSFVLQLNDTIAATPQATDNPNSYDCKLTTTYGNSISGAVSCPLGKQVEGTVRQLPSTGMGINIAFSAAVLIIIIYFYIRARQMSHEMRIIRRNFNVGVK